MIFSATTKDGKLSIKKRVAFVKYLYDMEGKDLLIQVEHAKGKKRTVEQNDLYFGILRKIMQVLIGRGYDDMNVVQLNNYFKRMFLIDIVPDVITGEPVEVVRGTSEITTTEFAEHIKNVVRFAIQDMDIKPDWLEPYMSKMD